MKHQPVPAAHVAEHDEKYGKKAVFAAALGYGLDGFDLLILSFALSGIMATFNIEKTQAGWLTTITLFGAVLGGLLFGVLSDRFGRVKTLTWSVVVFALFTGLCALAWDFWSLAAFRFIAGIGIGGEFGIGMTLAAEAVAAHKRARATSWVAVGFQVGVLCAALASAPIINTWGWRGLFVVGAFPAIIAAFFRHGVAEPTKFVDAKADGDLEKKNSMSQLFRDGRTSRITIVLIIMATIQNFGYFGIIAWLPNYLSNELNLGLNKGAVWTAVTVTGMMVGIILFGQLCDRIGRRYSFWIYQIGAAVSVLIYSQLTDPNLLLIGGFVMGAFANGMLGGLGALMAEHYPTEARATAQNVIFNIGRGFGGFAPVVIAYLATNGGFAYALGLLPIIYVIQFIAVSTLPERKGKELE
ncbi:MAG: MFS transporter [Corynebacterium sp.]|nr:MFS transporter [Corynebacterium sp.]